MCLLFFLQKRTCHQCSKYNSGVILTCSGTGRLVGADWGTTWNKRILFHLPCVTCQPSNGLFLHNKGTNPFASKKDPKRYSPILWISTQKRHCGQWVLLPGKCILDFSISAWIWSSKYCGLQTRNHCAPGKTIERNKSQSHCGLINKEIQARHTKWDASLDFPTFNSYWKTQT